MEKWLKIWTKKILFSDRIELSTACHGALTLKRFSKFISCKESKTKNSSVKNSPKKKKTGLREIGIEIQFFARDAV